MMYKILEMFLQCESNTLVVQWHVLPAVEPGVQRFDPWPLHLIQVGLRESLATPVTFKKKELYEAASISHTNNLSTRWTSGQ